MKVFEIQETFQKALSRGYEPEEGGYGATGRGLGPHPDLTPDNRHYPAGGMRCGGV